MLENELRLLAQVKEYKNEDDWLLSRPSPTTFRSLALQCPSPSPVLIFSSLCSASWFFHAPDNLIRRLRDQAIRFPP